MSPLSTLSTSDHHVTTLIRLLEDYAIHNPLHHQKAFIPRFDLEELAHTYELYGDFPGVSPADIIIETHNNRTLEISGTIAAPGKSSVGAPSSIGGPTDAEHYVNVKHEDAKEAEAKGPEKGVDRYEDALLPNPDARVKEEPKKVAAPGEPLPALGDTLLPHPPAPEGEASKKEEPKEEERKDKGQEPKHGEASGSKPTSRRSSWEGRRLSLFADTLLPVTPEPPAEEVAEEVKEEKKEEEKIKHILQERLTGSYHRVFHFPTPVDLDNIKARMDNGVLHVTIPRKEEEAKKKERVKVDWAGFIPMYGAPL
jgi:HSP20 family molecular chaperone IbpA